MYAERATQDTGLLDSSFKCLNEIYIASQRGDEVFFFIWNRESEFQRDSHMIVNCWFTWPEESSLDHIFKTRFEKPLPPIFKWEINCLKFSHNPSFIVAHEGTFWLIFLHESLAIFRKSLQKLKKKAFWSEMLGHRARCQRRELWM